METRSNRPAATRLARMVLDHSGRRWRIAETAFGRSTDGSTTLCLVLSTDNRYVRLRHYPSRWMSLTVEELLALAQTESREAHPPSRVEESRRSSGSAVRVSTPIAGMGMQLRDSHAAR
jgi:hypothetical protein